MARTTQEVHETRALRSYANLSFGETINFEALDLPEIISRDFDKPNLEIAERLTEAFSRAVEGGGANGDGIWERISSEYHKEFGQSLLKRNVPEVAATLARMFRNKVMYGLSSPANSVHSQVQILDTILSLAVAAGILPIRNPVDLKTESLFQCDYHELLEGLSEVFNYDLAPPQAGGIFGVDFRGKIIPLRQLFQTHTAHRINMILNEPAASCLEIGGGAGFLAYAAVKMRSVVDYCIIDLPIVNVLQGYLLLSSDLASSVELFGEEPIRRPDSTTRIRILPDNAIRELPDQSFDCAVNADSLPEMSEDTIRDYLGEIQRVCRGSFLSINQETDTRSDLGFVHGRVHDLIKDYPGFRLGSRAPFWPRKGYVEEIYHLTSHWNDNLGSAG